MEGKQYSKVVEEGLTFGQAMDKLLIHGKMITRAVWDGYWYKEFISYNGNEEQLDLYVRNNGHMVIMAKLKTGDFAVATPYQGDMIATDWMVVE